MKHMERQKHRALLIDDDDNDNEEDSEGEDGDLVVL